MNPSSQPEPLDNLIENAKKGSAPHAQESSVPFGLKTRVLFEISDFDPYDRLSFWRRSSLVFTGASLAIVLFMSFDFGSKKAAQPPSAILPLPALDFGEPPLR